MGSGRRSSSRCHLGPVRPAALRGRLPPAAYGSAGGPGGGRARRVPVDQRYRAEARHHPVAVDPIFPARRGATALWVSSDRVYFALTIIVLAVLLTVAFRFTKFGLATRAAAETERGAYLSGISPDRIAAYNWMLSSAVAGLVRHPDRADRAAGTRSPTPCSSSRRWRPPSWPDSRTSSSRCSPASAIGVLQSEAPVSGLDVQLAAVLRVCPN